MSALGQKRTFRTAIAMSALPPKADIRRRETNVRYGPIADISQRSAHDNFARHERKSGYANCLVGDYSIEIGCPTMMLRGDRVGRTSVIANPPLFRRSWNS
jgi:hypothetical protein